MEGSTRPALEEANSPAVASGVVYFSARGGSDLEAYEANGVTGCSGSPKVCSPLWTATLNGGSAPTVADGIVYIGGSNLQAYERERHDELFGDAEGLQSAVDGTGGTTNESSPAHRERPRLRRLSSSLTRSACQSDPHPRPRLAEGAHRCKMRATRGTTNKDGRPWRTEAPVQPAAERSTAWASLACG